MSAPTTVREALIVEALGDAATLIRQVEALAPMLNERCLAMVRADAHLRDTLSGFEARMAAVTEIAKTQVVQFMVTRVEEAGRRTVEQQSRVMVDAAKVAFSAELGVTLKRLNVALQALIDKQNQSWERWLMPLVAVVAATAASAATWLVALYLGRS